MAVETSRVKEAAWPDRRALARRRLGRPVTLVGALVAMIATDLMLPPAAFRAGALVAVSGNAVPASVGALKTIADLVVSKRVISAAAGSLIGTGYQPPPPSFLERLGVAFGFDGIHPTNAAARLAGELASGVVVAPGRTPGLLAISAQAPDADRSMRLASALAHALIAENDTMAAQARGQAQLEAADRLIRLRAEAAAARRRFVELGGLEADPAQVHAAATAQVALAQSRVDTLHVILASGSPPISDRRDVPPSIEAMQAVYLDVSRQIAKALETLGERHTTVIALRQEVRRASTNLSAEWRRLTHLAEVDLATARDRERAATKAEASIGDGRRDALAQARVAMQIADAVVAQTDRAMRDLPEEGSHLRLVGEPAAPTQGVGFGTPLRLVLSGLAGLLVFLLLTRLSNIAGAFRGLVPASLAKAELAEAHAVPVPVRETSRPALGTLMAATRRVDRGIEGAFVASSAQELVDRILEIEPASGAISTVVVVTSDRRADTTSAALSFGRAAAEVGRRVLIVDADATRPDLAAAADIDAEPLVVDLFGRLRVALPADSGDGTLLLAPGFAQGARLAAGLAARRETRIIDDLAAGFDLLIVDIGLARAPAVSDWAADAVVGVATRPDAGNDERLMQDLNLPNGLLIGMLAGPRFAAAAPRQRRWPDEVQTERPERKPAARQVNRAGAPVSIPQCGIAAMRAPQRRRVGAR